LEQPSDGLELYQGLKRWFDEYNTERRHKALEGELPSIVYEAMKRKTPEAA